MSRMEERRLRRRRPRRGGAAAFALWMTGATLGCATGPPTASLTVDPVVDGTALVVRGTSDLPDGTILLYEVRHERLEHDPETPIQMLLVEGSMTVDQGAFEAVVDLSNFEPGDVDVWVALEMQLSGGATQPRETVRRFGSDGARMEGGNVVDLGEDGKRLEVIVRVDRG